MADRQDFIDAVNAATLAFPDNTAALRILTGTLSLEDYHRLLLSLFHGTYEGPGVSALAASRCPEGYEDAREVLLQHAADGRSHWRWLLNDLQATGFTGPDPRTTFPAAEAQAYVAFNHYVAIKAPVARLAAIAVFESIAASFAANYSHKLFQCLGLKPHQTSFFFRREDMPRIEPIAEVVRRLPMTPRDWEWMVNTTRTTGALYKAIYDAL